MQARNVSFAGNYVKIVNPEAFKQSNPFSPGTTDTQRGSLSFMEERMPKRAAALPADTDLVVSLTRPGQWDIQLQKNNEPYGDKLTAKFNDYQAILERSDELVDGFKR